MPEPPLFLAAAAVAGSAELISLPAEGVEACAALAREVAASPFLCRLDKDGAMLPLRQSTVIRYREPYMYTKKEEEAG
jgi:hypothetical protein